MLKAIGNWTFEHLEMSQQLNIENSFKLKFTISSTEDHMCIFVQAKIEVALVTISRQTTLKIKLLQVNELALDSYII